MVNYEEADRILDSNVDESYHTLRKYEKNNDFKGAVDWVKAKTNCTDEAAEKIVKDFFDIPTYNVVSPDIKVECPYCHSKSTTKISATAKVVNTVMFGLFGNKRKHQWHCNNCNSDF